MDRLTENVKYAEINTKIMSAFVNTQTLNMIQQNTSVYVMTDYQQKFDEKLN